MPEKPIAYGRTAEIYAWEDGWVLKQFYNWFPEESVRYEAELVTITAQLDKLYGRLTSFSESAVELLEEAHLILAPDMPGN